MTAPLTSVCPVCAGPIQASRRGRPAVYCGKPCRQAAHRARDRAARALQDLAHLQRRLAADVDQLARLTAELTTLHTSTAVASAGSMTSGATRGAGKKRVLSPKRR